VIGVYVHVPYCTVRCSYCDFYLVAGPGRDPGAYVDALCNEISAVEAPLLGRLADAVHFGGGTPSLLQPAQVGRVLDRIRAVFAIPSGAEIALEANPEDVDAARLRGWIAAGVNRLSVGVQSIEDDLLRMMRRPHTAIEAMDAIAAARRAGVSSLGADLILGLPGQTRARTLNGIAQVVDLGVDHVSLYLLEVHSRTRLGREVALGRRLPMDEETASALYEEAADLLECRGFEHYEISNFARPGHRSRHNSKYWTDQDYLGFGPSAHSYVSGRRWSNAPRLDDYLARGGVGTRRIEDDPSRSARAAEALVAGLRLTEGVVLALLRGRYGADFSSPPPEAVADLVGAGLLEGDHEHLRLTRRGRLLSNEVFERLVP